jgi:hypothetical protein
VNRASILARSGRLDEGEAALIEGRRRADELGLPAMSWAALSSLATIALHRGDPARAIELADERLAIAERVGDERGSGSALTTIQAAALALGDTDRALAAGEKVIGVFRRTDDLDGVAVGAFNLVVLGQSSGDLKLAARWAGEAASAAMGSSVFVAQRLALLACGGLACSVGDERGLILLAAAGNLAADVNLDPSDLDWLRTCEEQGVAAAGDDLADRRRQEGHAMGVAPALALASQVAADLS